MWWLIAAGVLLYITIGLEVAWQVTRTRTLRYRATVVLLVLTWPLDLIAFCIGWLLGFADGKKLERNLKDDSYYPMHTHDCARRTANVPCDCGLEDRLAKRRSANVH